MQQYYLSAQEVRLIECLRDLNRCEKDIITRLAGKLHTHHARDATPTPLQHYANVIPIR